MHDELVTELIIPNGWATDKIAMKNISLLHTRLVGDQIINFFEVEADSIDSVLDIFVRVTLVELFFLRVIFCFLLLFPTGIKQEMK